MNTDRVCPDCGKPLDANAPKGLCQECLLKAGFPSASQTEPPGAHPFAPPSIEELAAKFPQLEVLELIGRGGMGAVYKARQKQLNRIVALKILPPGIGDQPSFAERFTREARALAALNHPGIVTLYEFGQTNGLFFFLMEYVDGVNLRELLNRGRISPREALAIVPQICDALQYAHDQGVVHRDIKPENILLDRKGRVKVADFGLARLMGLEGETRSGNDSPPASISLTEAGKVLGTPQYMAPEQKDRPTEVDHRADIYSLGVVLYQMLTGELPDKTIEPPSKKVILDVRLDEVVLRALEKEPAKRYQQASVLKTQVETIAAVGHSPITKANSRSRTYRWAALAAVMVVLYLAVSATVAYHKNIPEITSPDQMPSTEVEYGILDRLRKLNFDWREPSFGTWPNKFILSFAALNQLQPSGGTNAWVPVSGTLIAELSDLHTPRTEAWVIHGTDALADLQFVMVQESIKSQPLHSGAVATFGPEVQWPLRFDKEKNTDCFDFDTGSVIHLPKRGSPIVVSESGILPVGIAFNSDTNNVLYLLGMGGTVVSPVPLQAWNTMSPDKVLERAGKLLSSPDITVENLKQLPGAFVFKTRKGTVGLLFVIDWSRSPNAVEFCYKLVRQAGEKIGVRVHGEAKTVAVVPNESGIKIKPHANITNAPPGNASTPATGRTASSDFAFRWVAPINDTNSPADLLPNPNDLTGQSKLRVLKENLLTARDVESAGFTKYKEDEKELLIFLRPAGAAKFRDLTTTNIGRQLAIVWDGRVICAPVIQSAIVTPKVAISGRFTDHESELLLNVLNHRGSEQSESALMERMNDIRRIVLACVMFSDVHNNQWPTNLSETDAETTLKKPIEHLDYYRPPTSLGTNASSTPVLFDQDKRTHAGKEGQLVGFADGHVEFVTGAQIRKLLDSEKHSAPAPSNQSK